MARRYIRHRQASPRLFVSIPHQGSIGEGGLPLLPSDKYWPPLVVDAKTPWFIVTAEVNLHAQIGNGINYGPIWHAQGILTIRSSDLSTIRPRHTCSPIDGTEFVSGAVADWFAATFFVPIRRVRQYWQPLKLIPLRLNQRNHSFRRVLVPLYKGR